MATITKTELDTNLEAVGTRPGDIFNAVATWEDVLILRRDDDDRAILHSEADGVGYWTRSGKKASEGYSATTNALAPTGSSTSHRTGPSSTPSSMPTRQGTYAGLRTPSSTSKRSTPTAATEPPAPASSPKRDSASTGWRAYAPTYPKRLPRSSRCPRSCDSLVGTGLVQAPSQQLGTYPEPTLRILLCELSAGHGEGYFFGDEQYTGEPAASSSLVEFKFRHPISSSAGAGSWSRRPWASSCDRLLFWRGRSGHRCVPRLCGGL